MPRPKKHLEAAFQARRAVADRREREAWSVETKRASATGRSIVQAVLKQWITAAGESARMLIEMSPRRKGLSLEVTGDTTRAFGKRKAAAQLKRQHSNEVRPTGGYVIVSKPAIDRARFPLAAAFVDLWWNDRSRVGELAVAAVERVQGKRIAEQWANKYVRADLERAGRGDLWEAAKHKSGRKS